MMPDQPHDPLVALSASLATRVAAAAPLAVSIQRARRRPCTGTLWRPDIVIGSEQVFAKAADGGEIVFSDGRRVAARVAGRDPGTNVLALRLETPVETVRPAAGQAQFGGLALVLGTEPDGNTTVRLGVVRSLGPAWHSLHGGRIDRRITLDLRIGRSEEGGPVFDAAGDLLGMAAAGPHGQALVIPAATIERVLDPLLAAGRVERGWLGLALHPVALQDAAKEAAGHDRGLMVMQVAADGPAAKAGVLPGDILVAVDGAAAARPAEIARRFGPDSVGTEVELRLVRSGAPLTLAVTVTARPSPA